MGIRRCWVGSLCREGGFPCQIHKSCLKTWIQSKESYQCEVCNAPYRGLTHYAYRLYPTRVFLLILLSIYLVPVWGCYFRFPYTGENWWKWLIGCAIFTIWLILSAIHEYKAHSPAPKIVRVYLIEGTKPPCGLSYRVTFHYYLGDCCIGKGFRLICRLLSLPFSCCSKQEVSWLIDPTQPEQLQLVLKSLSM